MGIKANVTFSSIQARVRFVAAFVPVTEGEFLKSSDGKFFKTADGKFFKVKKS